MNEKVIILGERKNNKMIKAELITFDNLENLLIQKGAFNFSKENIDFSKIKNKDYLILLLFQYQEKIIQNICNGLKEDINNIPGEKE